MYLETPPPKCRILLEACSRSSVDHLSDHVKAFLVSYFNEPFKIMPIHVANERLWNQQVLVTCDHGDSFYDVLIDDDDQQALGVVFKDRDEWHICYARFRSAHTSPFGYNPLMIEPIVTMRRMFAQAQHRYLTGRSMISFFHEEGFYLY